MLFLFFTFSFHSSNKRPLQTNFRDLENRFLVSSKCRSSDFLRIFVLLVYFADLNGEGMPKLREKREHEFQHLEPLNLQGVGQGRERMRGALQGESENGVDKWRRVLLRK